MGAPGFPLGAGHADADSRTIGSAVTTPTMIALPTTFYDSQNAKEVNHFLI
jgi:hypothetical protein